jgi:trimethylamine--corrinoid protein Co-methyltransferase
MQTTDVSVFDRTSSGARDRALRILSDADLQELDAAAVRIVENVGVAMPSAVAREALATAGAEVDGERVRIRGDLLHDLAGLAPRHLTLGARAGATLKTGSGSLLTTDGCCTEIYDITDGEKRPTTAQDVADISRLVDALDQIDFCWPAVSAQDVPVERRGLCELYLALANTGKHVQTVTIVEPGPARTAVEMVVAVAGGEAESRAAPPISALLGTVTPLGNDAGTLEAALVFAAAGVPIGFVTMPMGGSTTPLTEAGSLAVGVAEALTAVAAIQAAHPGAQVFICFIPSFMDLKSGDFTGGAPEDTVMGAAVGDIGRYYGLPTQCGVNSAGAKASGWQTAVDDVATTFLSLLNGVDMLTGVGMVAGGRIFSLEEMVLATQVTVCARSLAAAGGLRETPGPAGASLLPVSGAGAGQVHDALDGDEEDAVGWSRRRARDLLATHVPTPLPDTVDDELRRLVGAPPRP